jgi:hypothetical protein
VVNALRASRQDISATPAGDDIQRLQVQVGIDLAALRSTTPLFCSSTQGHSHHASHIPSPWRRQAEYDYLAPARLLRGPMTDANL